MPLDACRVAVPVSLLSRLLFVNAQIQRLEETGSADLLTLGSVAYFLTLPLLRKHHVTLLFAVPEIPSAVVESTRS